MKWMILVFVALLLTSGCTTEKKTDVCISGKCFHVTLAATPEARQKGLMGAQSLAKGTGMLFVFPEEGNYSFWMKDMKFPLDIVWISGEGKIVYISSYTQPCEPLQPCPSITPPAYARYVLEVNAGEAYDFSPGDDVTLPENL